MTDRERRAAVTRLHRENEWLRNRVRALEVENERLKKVIDAGALERGI